MRHLFQSLKNTTSGYISPPKRNIADVSVSHFQNILAAVWASTPMLCQLEPNARTDPETVLRHYASLCTDFSSDLPHCGGSINEQYQSALRMLAMHAAEFTSFFHLAIQTSMIWRPRIPEDHLRRDPVADMAIASNKLLAACHFDRKRPYAGPNVSDEFTKGLLGDCVLSLPWTDQEACRQAAYRELVRVSERFAANIIRSLLRGVEHNCFGYFATRDNAAAQYSFFTRLAYPEPVRDRGDVHNVPIALHIHNAVRTEHHVWPAQSVRMPHWVLPVIRSVPEFLRSVVTVVDGDLLSQQVILREPNEKQVDESDDFFGTPIYEPCVLLADIAVCGWTESDLRFSPEGLALRHEPAFDALFDEETNNLLYTHPPQRPGAVNSRWT